MKTRQRLCWWCNRRLMAVSHALVEGRQVHKMCEDAARRSFATITAQPPEPTNSILAAGISRERLARDLEDAAEEDGMG